MYFARMKRQNKSGPKVLGSRSQPQHLSVGELAELADRTDVTVVDTRLDRSAFMAGHLPGSLYAPLNRAFNTVVGSFVEEDVPIYLIVEERQLDEAVRDLIRIGLDDVAGYATPETLMNCQKQGGVLATIEEINFEKVGALRKNGAAVIDVRGTTEFAAGHISGAINIAHTRLWVRRGEVPADQKLIVHCQSGGRAAVSAALLARLGHNVTFVNDALPAHRLASGEHAKGDEITAAV